jgi:uncharacterized protein YegJ (DUF2314 family)
MSEIDFSQYRKEQLYEIDCGRTYMREIANNVVRELQAKKEQVIKAKFAEKGFGHLLENIETRRFKKVVVERYDNCEEWWADNGTEEGILIVTFFNSPPQFTNNIGQEFKMTTEIKYY